MTKATALQPDNGLLFFTDPADGRGQPVTKVEPKEADGQPRGKVHAPATGDQLAKLAAKFAK